MNFLMNMTSKFDYWKFWNASTKALSNKDANAFRLALPPKPWVNIHPRVLDAVFLYFFHIYLDKDPWWKPCYHEVIMELGPDKVFQLLRNGGIHASSELVLYTINYYSSQNIETFLLYTKWGFTDKGIFNSDSVYPE